MKIENNDRLTDFKILLEKFYDGSASPDETGKLYALAKVIAKAGRDQLPPELWNDIVVLTAFDNFSLGVAENLEAATPPGLEELLRKHVHSLAVSEKRPVFSPWRKIRRGCAVAAAVALILFGGYHLISDSVSSDHSFPAPVENTASIAPLTPRDTDTVAASPTVSLLAQKALPVKPAEVASRIRNRNANEGVPLAGKDVASDIREEANIDEYPGIDVVIASLETDSGSEIPEIAFEPADPLVASLETNAPEETEEIISIPNTISLTNMDPSTSLTMPMTTLSASLDNVFRSINLLSESLSMSWVRQDSEKERVASIPTQPI